METKYHGVSIALSINQGNLFNLDTIWPQDSSQYIFSNLEKEIPYKFSAMSFYEKGISSMVSDSLFIPKSPSSLMVDLVKNGINLNWQDESSGETFTIIERKVENNDWFKYDSVPVNITSFTDTSVINDQTYTYRIYAVTKKTWSAMVYSDTISYRKNGIPNSLLNDCNIKIYPNPATNFIHINASASCFELNKIQIKLSDLYGRTVHKGSLKEVIKISQYPEGVYWLQLFYEEALINQKKVVIIR